jgi:hypothetical protein
MQYVRFVLSDLPLDVRLKAARAVADGIARELRRDCLYGYVPTAVRAWGCLEAVWVTAEAHHPRDRREYIVERAEWGRVIGPLPTKGVAIMSEQEVLVA